MRARTGVAVRRPDPIRLKAPGDRAENPTEAAPDPFGIGPCARRGVLPKLAHPPPRGWAGPKWRAFLGPDSWRNEMRRLVILASVVLACAATRPVSAESIVNRPPMDL